MTRAINHFEYVDGTYVDTYGVAATYLMVYRHISTVNTELLRGFDFSPNIMSIMFTLFPKFSLKIRIYWQIASCLVPVCGL